MPIVNKNEQKRYRDKIGRLQHRKNICKNNIISNGIIKESVVSGNMDKELAEIFEKINLLQLQYEEMIKKVDLFDNKIGAQSEAGLVVYDAPIDGTVFREKKGLFGKTKWIEEKA